mmetsp:Transcript_42434/g.133032  ORF Transcript_42434/g.133032 Transcript_42434/m.133032 type:complete len:205 (+) Transcript_42434:111-725(+)
MTASCTSVKPEAAGAAMSPSRASPTSPSPEPARDLPPVPSWFSSATRAECWLRVARWLHNKSAGAEWSFGSTTRVRAHLHLPHPLRLRGLEVLLQHLALGGEPHAEVHELVVLPPQPPHLLEVVHPLGGPVRAVAGAGGDGLAHLIRNGRRVLRACCAIRTAFRREGEVHVQLLLLDVLALRLGAKILPLLRKRIALLLRLHRF